MRGPVLVLLAVLTALPAAAAAQLPVLRSEPIWGPSIRVTPYAGFAPGFTRTEQRVSIHDNTAAVTFDEVDVSMASGLATGLAVEARIWNRFSLIGSALWLRRGDTEEYSLADDTFVEFSGSDMYMGKAGLAMRLREGDEEVQLRTMSAAFFVAPAVVVDEPRDGLFSVSQEQMTLFALNYGVEGEMPLPDRRFAIQAQLEDFVIWWDDDQLRQRVDRLNEAEGRNVTTFLDARTSHMWLVRLGLSFRFM
jgi:hypothetical protein